VRPDVRIVANDVLMSIDGLADVFLPVDTFSKRSLIRSLRAIDQALENKEAVIIFPAGEVSRLTLGGVLDGRWQSGAVSFAKRHNAPVLPVFINGRNSLFFYVVSLLAKSFSTLLLPMELFRRRRKSVSFHIGACIPAKSFAALDTRVATRLLRHQTYVLKTNRKGPFETEQSIIPPVHRQRLLKQLAGGFDMGSPAAGRRLFVVTKSNAPLVIREIARLREVTFRKIGEGTGRKMDDDMYDESYHHLVLWDERELEIAGAYRLGICREIVGAMGEKGLYTSTLFTYSHEMRERLHQSVELGRSFIQPQYQNSYALEYLWAGIGAIWERNKEFKYLFGPVSISNAFPVHVKDALVFFYRKWFGAAAPLAASHCPYEIGVGSDREMAGYFLGTTYKEDLNLLKLRLRVYGATIPTMLRQYTELTANEGVSFSDFGVDQAFGDCIDGFVVVDMHALSSVKRERFIERYKTVLNAPDLLPVGSVRLV